MQELPVYIDQAGIQWETINRDCSQCERACQGPAGEWVIQTGASYVPVNCLHTCFMFNQDIDTKNLYKKSHLAFKSWKPSAKSSIICTYKEDSSHSQLFIIYVLLGGQTGSWGIHQQIIQRAKLLTPTLPCAFPQGKKAYVPFWFLLIYPLAKLIKICFILSLAIANRMFFWGAFL